VLLPRNSGHLGAGGESGLHFCFGLPKSQSGSHPLAAAWARSSTVDLQQRSLEPWSAYCPLWNAGTSPKPMAEYEAPASPRS
jgi:hypothetical protein